MFKLIFGAFYLITYTILPYLQLNRKGAGFPFCGILRSTTGPAPFLSMNSMRTPTKPAMHSNSKPAGYSDLKPATRGVVRMGQFHDVVEGWEGQEIG